MVSVEEYFRLTEKPYREYRDGVVSQKALANKQHSIIQYAPLGLLQGVRALPELTVRISLTKYLVPTSVWRRTIFLVLTRPSRSCSAARSCLRKIASARF